VLTVEYLSRVEGEGERVILREEEFCEDLQTVMARAQAIARANPSIESVVVRNERGDAQWAWVSSAALAAPRHRRKKTEGAG
jgi:hypothetical protein